MCVYIAFKKFHSSVDGYLGSFHLIAILNKNLQFTPVFTGVKCLSPRVPLS